ncbi:MAG: nucleotidyltransferase domain-containing protein [Bdellovibrionota bacterium]
MDSFENDKVLLKILDELQNEHDCHTAILYGSRARGDATDTSDYDVLGLRGKEPNIMVAKPIDGYFADAFVYSDAYVDAHTTEFLRVRGGKVLFQRGHQGTKLISKVEALYRKGPEPLRPDEIQQRKTWIDKTFARMLRGDIEAQYRRHWLLFNLLEDYFALRGLWYRGSKESFRYLADKDPKAHLLFENALSGKAKDSDIRKLCDFVRDTQPRALENSP